MHGGEELPRTRRREGGENINGKKQKLGRMRRGICVQEGPQAKNILLEPGDGRLFQHCTPKAGAICTVISGQTPK